MILIYEREILAELQQAINYYEIGGISKMKLLFIFRSAGEKFKKLSTSYPLDKEKLDNIITYKRERIN